ncbi:crotonase/enoyl-CoA hydratase family protein [Gordonia phthalatica]|uniref:Enoyl-CoA hydratase n=1 Tax=Gordonia phthalatica TaxID=1136941 RepID=A0A0N9NCV8_9ACTN|nr:crotonase/enoyl-CoA hydratase family protein [Gordonia phthalatica]ALG83318.1 enoyl-CoA hydratase [Gordonia phthalatica]
MTTSPLLIERDGHVVTWTLNTPETRNPISEPDMVEAIENAVADVAADPTVRVAILTGAGSAFSSGGNVKHMRDKTGMFGGTPAELRQGYRHGIQRITRAVYHCEIPIVAAVNGPAIGAGCDLSLMCDLRVASTNARFAESFVKVGIIPGDGGAWLLPRIVGAARAAEMALTGDAISAATALDWGLVSSVHEPDELLAAARALADRVAVNPPQVIRMTKRLLRESQHQTLESALEFAAAMQSIAHQTNDHLEAVNAMLERRDPEFTGQ